MKILLVCSSLGGGGAERVAVNLANSMAKAGHLVTFFFRRNVDDIYSLDNQVVVKMSSRESFFGSFFSLRKALKNNDFDAVISFADIPNIITFLSFSLLSNRPLFVPTIHSNLVARDARSKRSLRLKLVYFLNRLACRSAKKVVTVSEGARKSLINYYSLDKSKVVTIYNPVLSDNDAVLEKKYPVHKNEIRLVAAGRLATQKNYYMMINAVKHLNNSHQGIFVLDIFGKGELLNELMSYVNQQGMQEFIFFKGFDCNLKYRISTYDVFLLSSDWEGFGNVIVEALCCGLPVVSTDCPSGPVEILDSGKFGRLVAVNDAKGFAEAIAEEITFPLEIDTKLLAKHLDRFRESTIANEYIQLIVDLQSQ